MNQQLIHAYKASNKRRYHKLRDDNCSSMVIKTPTKDRLPRTHSNEDRPDPRYAFPAPMASQLMYPRELYPERNEQPSRLQLEDREMAESPFERDCAERNDYDTGMHGRSSYCYGQEEQRDRPEYSTVQNHCPQNHVDYQPYDERTSYENIPPTWSSADTTISSPPRVRNVSSNGSGRGTNYHQGSHHHPFGVDEKDYSRKREPRAYPIQTRHYNINEARPQMQRPLVPLYGYRSVGHPSLGIHHLRLPPRFLPMLDQIANGCERHAATLSNGWKTNLYSLTKQDIALAEVPHLYEIARPIMSYLKAAVSQLYGIRSMKVDKNQPHVLKYAGCHKGVEMHHDKSDVTMNIMLSRSQEYRGGGTYFRDANENVRLEFGEFLLHPGDAVHGGTPITDGTRYLMVIFANEKL